MNCSIKFKQPMPQLCKQLSFLARPASAERLVDFSLADHHGMWRSAPLCAGFGKVDWALEDPKDKSIERVRKKDEIRCGVRNLVHERLSE